MTLTREQIEEIRSHFKISSTGDSNVNPLSPVYAAKMHALCDMALIAALEPQWLPIESAPKDGTHILCYLPYVRKFMQETWWYIDERGGVWFDEDGEVCPTHWMPLPAAPATEGER